MPARFFTILALAVVAVSGTGCAQPTPTNIPPTPDKAAPAKTMTAGAVFLATLAAEQDATEVAKPTDDPGAGATKTAGAAFLATLAADRKQATDESKGPSEPRAVSREEFGDKWPFTVESGMLFCDDEKVVTFIADGKRYHLIGPVETGWASLDLIRAEDPANPGRTKDMSTIVVVGLSLCQ